MNKIQNLYWIQISTCRFLTLILKPPSWQRKAVRSLTKSIIDMILLNFCKCYGSHIWLPKGTAWIEKASITCTCPDMLHSFCLLLLLPFLPCVWKRVHIRATGLRRWKLIWSRPITKSPRTINNSLLVYHTDMLSEVKREEWWVMICTTYVQRIRLGN